MKRIPYALLAALIVLSGSFSIAHAISVFTSNQVGASPTPGYVLQTKDGINSTWVATSTLGIGGGGGGSGTVTSVNVSGGTTGLTTSGGPVTTSGTITLAGTLGVANGGTGANTLSGLLKGNGTSAFTVGVNGTDYTLITANTCSFGNHVSAITAAGVITCSADTGAGGTGLATTSPWIVGQLAQVNSSGSVNSIATSSLGLAPATTGSSILKGNGSGGFSSAVAGTDYQAPITLTTTGTSGAATFTSNTLNIPNYANTTYTAGTGLTLTGTAFSVNTSQNISTLSNLTTNGLIKTSGGTGALSIATAGTDYAPATSGSSLLYGNGSGGFSNATVGTGLSFTGGTLTATGGGGGSPAGSSTQIQYNNSGSFGASSLFTFVPSNGNGFPQLTMGTGGMSSVIAGANATGNDVGNNLSINSGNGSGTGFGGALVLTAGDSGGTSGAGGSVQIRGGSAAGSGAFSGGSVLIQSGFASGSGFPGSVVLSDPYGTNSLEVNQGTGITLNAPGGFSLNNGGPSVFLDTNSLSTSQSVSFPDASGNILLDSNSAIITNKDLTSGTNTFPTFNQNTTGSAAKLTTGRTISITGDLAYTSPSFDGSGNVTAAGTLATVNSNVGSFTCANITANAKGLITSAANGTCSGGGGGSGTVGTSSPEVAGYFPLWSTTSGSPALLTGTSSLFYDSSTGNVGLNTLSPDANFTSVMGGLGGVASDVDGIMLQNPTAAAAGAQQWSPSLTWEGQAWKSNATAASEPIRFQEYVTTSQGSSAPTGSLEIRSSINGGAYLNPLTYTSAGLLTAAGGFQSNAGPATLAFSSVVNGTASITGGNFESYVSGAVNNTSSSLVMAGSSNVGVRTAFNGSTASTLTASANYGAVIFGNAPIATATTGTHPMLANLVVEPIGSVTNAGASVTNTASLYIDGAATTTVTGKNYALYVNSGDSLLNGTTTLGSRVFASKLTTSAITQGSAICGSTSTGGELIAESVSCLASAARYKTDIATTTFSIDGLMKLNPISFDWKKDYLNGNTDPNVTGTQYSLVADEVQKVFPQLVAVTSATTTWEGKEIPAGSVQGLEDLNHWVSAIVSWLQQIVQRQDAQQTQIDQLQAQLKAQQVEIDSLKKK